MNNLTVPATINNIFKNYQQQIAFIHRQPIYRKKWTFSDVQLKVEDMVAHLQSKNIQKGDKVAICGPNSPWWIVTYLACASIGAIVVPIDFNSSEDFVNSVLKKTNSKLLYISAFKPYSGVTETITIEDLANTIAPAPRQNIIMPKISPDDVLEIVYTSGSTGDPKGVVLTHKNVVSNMNNFLIAWPRQKHETSLSLVPLSHMLEQTAGFWSPFMLGSTIVYISSLRPSEISLAIREEGVTSIITVPAFLQLLRRRVFNQIDTASLKGQFAMGLIKVTKILPKPLARTVAYPIRKNIGVKLTTLAVGGAGLPVDVENFWNELGYNVIQGYGLTETSPLATYSSRLEHKQSSVGKCLPNQQLKLSDNGELLLKGDNVFKGYYNDDTATKAVFDNNGWFHTGDIAEVDDDGFVFLKGRIKNILISSNGLNIYPEDIEAKILNNSVIKDVVVLMDNSTNEPRLTAVILSDSDNTTISNIIGTVNMSLASFQNIRNIIKWPDSDFPRTATRKIRRNIVQEAVNNNSSDTSHAPSHDKNTIQMILRQLTNFNGEISDEMILNTDFAIDSIKKLELVSLIEEKFLIIFDETQITQTTNVGQLTKMVDKSRTGTAKHSNQNYNTTQNKFILYVQSFMQALMLMVLVHYQKLTCAGWEPTSSPAIYVANHSSHFDALTLLRVAGFKRRQKVSIVVAKDYFFDKKLKAWLSRTFLHAIPVDRSGNTREGMARIGKELSNGNSVIIFPEGTRSLNGKIQAFKPGIGFLASQVDIPIVPVKIIGTYNILPKNRNWPKRGTTRVVFGKPRYYSIKQTPDLIAHDLQNEVEAL